MTHELIFSWLSWLAVLLVGAVVVVVIDGVAQHGGHNRNEAKLIFVGFLWLSPIDLIRKCFQRTNVKEKSGEQELTGTENARKIAK